MREIVLDTETTGFEPTEGHKIVEIGAVELFNHLPTGQTFHQYINPKRNMPKEAFQVHGLGDEFLADKPIFQTIAADFLKFIADTPLIIHNASFDMKFLNHELRAAGFAPIPNARAVDTLLIARAKFPGSPASLDALCRRFGIDNSAREKHGALLDSEILAEVYLELIGGRQPDFGLNDVAIEKPGLSRMDQNSDWRPSARPSAMPSLITEAEAAAHEAMIAKIGDAAIWAKRR